MEQVEAVLLGTGCSTGIPILHHVLTGCPWGVCKADGMDPKDFRNNVSMLLKVGTGPSAKHIMVDCGKTFRDTAMKLFPGMDVRALDAVFITHGHADAFLGMDDLREFTSPDRVIEQETGRHIGYHYPRGRMSVVCTHDAYRVCAGAFEYLTAAPVLVPRDEWAPSVIEAMAAAKARGESDEVHLRFTANLTWRRTDYWHAALSCGVPVQTFPVLHGRGFYSLGFAFGAGGEFVYISDVSEIEPDVLDFLRSARTHPAARADAAALADADGEWRGAGDGEPVPGTGHVRHSRPAWAFPGPGTDATRIDTLVVDALNMKIHPTHFGVEEAMELARAVRPRRLVIVGSACSLGSHADAEEAVRAAGKDMEGEVDIVFGFDGMRLGSCSISPIGDLFSEAQQNA